MGIRETLNQNQAITTGATIGIIVIALGFIVYQVWPQRIPQITEAYYTTDDSSQEAAMKALFTDKITLNAPFDKGGKPAYRANVFKSGKTRWIGWLERYNPQAKAKLDEAANSKDPQAQMAVEDLRQSGLEVKRPGDKDWIKANQTAKFDQIRGEVNPPAGTNPETIEQEWPR